MTTERKVCEEIAVLKLPELCPNWPNCRAHLKAKEVYERGLHGKKVGAEALGYFCDCESVAVGAAVPSVPSIALDVRAIRDLSGDAGVRALFQGCRAGTAAVQYGVDLSAEIVEREQR